MLSATVVQDMPAEERGVTRSSVGIAISTRALP